MDGVADFTIFNSVVPPGWTSVNGTVDLMNATTTVAGVAWEPSNGGGTFVRGIGFAPGSESFAKLVTGLASLRNARHGCGMDASTIRIDEGAPSRSEPSVSATSGWA